MAYLPICLDLGGKRCLVAGGGSLALKRTRALLRAGASVVVVSPDCRAGLLALSGIEIRNHAFQPADLDGIYLCIAATSDEDANRACAEACRARGILCNAVDDPAHSDFIFPAVAERGGVHVAVSTAGDAPALAKRLCHDFEDLLPPHLDAYTAFLRQARDWAKTHLPDRRERARLAGTLASAEGFDTFLALSPEERGAWIERIARGKEEA
jgi:uroporphyrin-III C-methyltransferase/precorrin-2 dehydrogenase/sirohydrochlorin ferrochelatase